MSKYKYLVCGAGGFIGGYLVKSLIDEGHEVVCADIKPLEFWFQIFDNCKNYSLDLKEIENCEKVSEGVDFIEHLTVLVPRSSHVLRTAYVRNSVYKAAV